MLSPDASGYGTGSDAPGRLILPRDPAHGTVPGHCPVKGAVQQLSAVDPGDPPHLRLRPGRTDAARHDQIADQSGLRHDAEQSGNGIFRSDPQAADGMALSLKGAAENRDRLKFHPAQIQVAAQPYDFPLRPGVQRTLFGKLRQILRRTNLDLIFRRPRRGRRRSRSHAQHSRQQQGKYPFKFLHGGPPFPL